MCILCSSSFISNYYTCRGDLVLEQIFPHDLVDRLCQWILQPVMYRWEFAETAGSKFSQEDKERFEARVSRYRARLFGLQMPLDVGLSLEDAQLGLLQMFLHAMKQDGSMPLLPPRMKYPCEQFPVILPPIRLFYHPLDGPYSEILLDLRHREGDELVIHLDGSVLFRGRILRSDRVVDGITGGDSMVSRRR